LIPSYLDFLLLERDRRGVLCELVVALLPNEGDSLADEPYAELDEEEDDRSQE